MADGVPVRLFRNSDGGPCPLGAGCERAFSSVLLRRCGALVDRGGHLRHDHQPLPVLLASKPGGGRPTREASSRAPREGARTGTEALERIRLDTYVGMAFSNLVALAIIVTTAATFHVNGITDVESSSQAAEALRPACAGRSRPAWPSRQERQRSPRRHTPGDLDPHGHRDTSVKEVPGPHHDHPGHQPGDLDPHGHRDKSAPPKP